MKTCKKTMKELFPNFMVVDLKEYMEQLKEIFHIQKTTVEHIFPAKTEYVDSSVNYTERIKVKVLSHHYLEELIIDITADFLSSDYHGILLFADNFIGGDIVTTKILKKIANKLPPFRFVAAPLVTFSKISIDDESISAVAYCIDATAVRELKGEHINHRLIKYLDKWVDKIFCNKIRFGISDILDIYLERSIDCNRILDKDAYQKLTSLMNSRLTGSGYPDNVQFMVNRQAIRNNLFDNIFGHSSLTHTINLSAKIRQIIDMELAEEPNIIVMPIRSILTNYTPSENWLSLPEWYWLYNALYNIDIDSYAIPRSDTEKLQSGSQKLLLMPNIAWVSYDNMTGSKVIEIYRLIYSALTIHFENLGDCNDKV